MVGFFLLCFILYASALDVVGFEFGKATVKLQIFLFPLMFFLIIIKRKIKLSHDGLLYVAFFLFCLVPSLFVSDSPLISFGFLFGTFSCVTSLFVSEDISKRLSLDVLYDGLIYSYRGSVFVTFIFVAAGLQARGHFILYESSYWAIFLIPYISIVAYRFFCDKFNYSRIDFIVILAGIVLSQSASLVIWILLIVFAFMISLGKIKLIHVFSVCATLVLAFLLLVAFNARTSHLYHQIMVVDDISSFMGVLIFLAGNRIQRLLVPIEVGADNPFFGVGGGMLRNVVSSMSVDDFKIYDQSAYDFVLDSSAPGVNVFFEIFAEHGLLGVLGFLVFLVFIYRRTLCSSKLLPLRIALVVTLISLLIESNYMRYYLWVLMGIILGLAKNPTIRDGYKNDNI